MYVIITRDQCNFCDDAKALMKGNNIQYTEYNVQSQSSRWLLSLLVQAGCKTVPQIFNADGKHIGGFTEFKEYLNG